MRNSKNVGHYLFGHGVLAQVPELLSDVRKKNSGPIVFLIDSFFKQKKDILSLLSVSEGDELIFVSAEHEPITEQTDEYMQKLRMNLKGIQPGCLVGMGGGTTLDYTKALSILFCNDGSATQYQGWDLVEYPALYKVGIPTISGTGAEASRTCVLMNIKKNLKLGMNSQYSIFDQLILDPALTATVPRDQYFYTGMDTYIHCIESLEGRFRHPVGDAFSRQALDLCHDVFLKDHDMMDEASRANLMVASYLGGCAIANSYVGIVHPFSAGLSVVLGIHHCLANCLVMNVLEEYYPKAYQDFIMMKKKQGIVLPKGLCSHLSDEQYHRLYLSTIVHEKPLMNALGENFKNILTEHKVKEIFQRI